MWARQSDPRFLSTLKRILYTPERGGLTSNVSSPLSQTAVMVLMPTQGLVYRYDVNKADDGVGGDEGTSVCARSGTPTAHSQGSMYDRGV